MKYKLFPFSGSIEKKKSKEGKEYLAVAVSKAEKKQDGSWDNKYLNMFPEDLLKLSAVIDKLKNELVVLDEYKKKEERVEEQKKNKI